MAVNTNIRNGIQANISLQTTNMVPRRNRNAWGHPIPHGISSGSTNSYTLLHSLHLEDVSMLAGQVLPRFHCRTACWIRARLRGSWEPHCVEGSGTESLETATCYAIWTGILMQKYSSPCLFITFASIPRISILSYLPGCHRAFIENSATRVTLECEMPHRVGCCYLNIFTS